MTYQLVFSKRAAKELADLPRDIVSRLDKEIQSLAEKPRPADCKKLKGKFADGYRVRVGDYRILYLIDDQQHRINIYRVGHRRDIYE